jgi:hypothetical protein
MFLGQSLTVHGPVASGSVQDLGVALVDAPETRFTQDTQAIKSQRHGTEPLPAVTVQSAWGNE